MRRAILAALVLLAAAPAFAQEDTDADADADDDCVCTVGEQKPACKEVCDPTSSTNGGASCAFVAR